jgi:hypothetical protein
MAQTTITVLDSDGIERTITLLALAEDAAHVSGDQGYMLLAVRKDTAIALAGTDGDYIPLIVDANGRLHIVLSSMEKGEDDAHVSGDKGLMLLAVRKDTAVALAGADADYIPLIVDANGRLHTVLSSLEKAEDDAHNSGDKGVMLLVVRKDAEGALAGADGDYSPLQLDDKGNLRTVAKGRVFTKTATIASGQSLSGEVDLEDAEYVSIVMPAAWDAASLTFQASPTSGGTFYDVYNAGGSEMSLTVAAQRVVTMRQTNVHELLPTLRYIKIRSGTSGTPVNQTAQRDITLICKR